MHDTQGQIQVGKSTLANLAKQNKLECIVVHEVREWEWDAPASCRRLFLNMDTYETTHKWHLSIVKMPLLMCCSVSFMIHNGELRKL